MCDEGVPLDLTVGVDWLAPGTALANSPHVEIDDITDLGVFEVVDVWCGTFVVLTERVTIDGDSERHVVVCEPFYFLYDCAYFLEVGPDARHSDLLGLGLSETHEIGHDEEANYTVPEVHDIIPVVHILHRNGHNASHGRFDLSCTSLLRLVVGQLGQVGWVVGVRPCVGEHVFDIAFAFSPPPMTVYVLFRGEWQEDGVWVVVLATIRQTHELCGPCVDVVVQ